MQINTENTRSVKEEDITNLLDNSNVQEYSFHNKEVLVSYKLKDRGGYTITGRGAVVDKAKFDYELGKQVAKRDAMTQLWKLEGYLKQLELAGVIKFT